ncbi:MAG: aminodeoxychorismate synthase, component I [Verrucomicrobiales bacterium]|nr:aminodeoxychorismate synthase, component I [Verrucomicrobiales bacterium]
MTTRPCIQVAPIPYLDSSCNYFERIRHLDFPILLDSNAKASNGRFDIIAAQPVALLSSVPTKALNYVASNEPIDFFDLSQADSYDSFELINTAIGRFTTKNSCHDHSPFVSGAIGVFSYDFGMPLNQIAAPDQGHWPSLVVGIYQWAIVQDHQQRLAWLLADPKYDHNKFDRLATSLERDIAKQDRPALTLTSEWQLNGSKEDYQQAFNRSKAFINAGDCYQINFAQQFTASYQGDTWQAYKQLRTVSPTPFAVYFELPQSALVSLSPERFIQVNQTAVKTQPIKGTRKRANNGLEDAKLMAELSGSEKDRAENLMIVDLMRNDIGKCCELGSVNVPSLFQIETHPNVHHMVSTVKGSLPENSTLESLRLLSNTLPGGSVTGAPKRRSMEIIDQLENFSRSVYCGSVAYINNSGDMDSNILIRSLLFSQQDEHSSGQVNCWGGGGIVADSELEAEYKESLHKINNLLTALASN